MTSSYATHVILICILLVQLVSLIKIMGVARDIVYVLRSLSALLATVDPFIDDREPPTAHGYKQKRRPPS